MPAIEIQIDAKQFGGLEKLLTWSFWEKPLRASIAMAAGEGERVAKQKARPHAVDTGETSRSIIAHIQGSSALASARIYGATPVVAYVNYGRNPGRIPPDEPIRGWAIRHGISSSLTYVIRRSIGRKGTRGLHMFEAARARILEVLPHVLSYNMAAHVSQIGGSGG